MHIRYRFKYTPTSRHTVQKHRRRQLYTHPQFLHPCNFWSLPQDLQPGINKYVHVSFIVFSCVSFIVFSYVYVSFIVSYAYVYVYMYTYICLYLSSYPMLMYTYICKRIYLRIFHRILMFHRVFRFIFVVGFCCKMLINNTYGVSCR